MSQISNLSVNTLLDMIIITITAEFSRHSEAQNIRLTAIFILTPTVIFGMVLVKRTPIESAKKVSFLLFWSLIVQRKSEARSVNSPIKDHQINSL